MQIPRSRSIYANRTHLRILLLGCIAVVATWFAITSHSAEPSSSPTETNPRQESAPVSPKQLEPGSRATIEKNYGNVPLSFEANHGQTDVVAKYLARGPGYNIFLTPTEAVLVFGERSAKERLRGPENLDEGASTAGRSTRASVSPLDRNENQNTNANQPTVLRMRLEGANPGARAIEGVDKLPGKVNYFLGADSSKWRTDIPTYGKVSYPDAYPGIDLVFYGNQHQLEYDFVVAPGADPNVIKLRFDGAQSVRVDQQGNLVIQTSGGEIRQGKPTIFQEIDGVRKEIVGGYELKSGDRVGFKVKDYDQSRTLVIDPILSYLSIVNSGGFGAAIAVDQDGSAYITGTIEGFEQLPPTSGAFQIAYGGGFWDIFVTKLNAAGTGVVYSTYLGSNGEDAPYGIAVDGNRNAYITGYTGGTYPTTAGAFRTVRPSSYDAVVTKLNPTGSGLVYSTLFGGNAYDEGDSILVDAAGSAYVSGTSDSNNLPTTGGAVSLVNSGGYDGFLVKLNPGGTGVDYCTYLGGNAFDGAYDIALDIFNNLVVVGQTGSLNYPAVNSLQQPHGLDRGTFKSTNNGLSWSLSRNGLGGGNVNALAIDPANHSVVYAATPGGVWKTLDAGANWSPTGTIQGHVYTVAIDPSNTSIVYAGTTVGAFKSINGGTSWTPINNGLLRAPGPDDIPRLIQQFAIDRNTTTTIYAAAFGGMLKTTDGGGTWTGINTGLTSSSLRGVVIDPSNSSIIYCMSNSRIFKSTDAGASWTRLTAGLAGLFAIRGLTINPLTPGTLFVGSEVGVYKTTDGGASWSPSNTGLLQLFTDGVSRLPEIDAIAIDPITPTNMYAAVGYQSTQGYLNSGAHPLATVFKSTDGGSSWSPVTNGFNSLNSGIFALAINPVNPSIVYAGTQGDAEAFVSKINQAAQLLSFSSYLGGGLVEYASGVGVDAAGATYITGLTESLDFPTTPGAIQTNRQGGTDAFVTKIGANNALSYSTYLGGGGTEEALGLAVDLNGNAYVAGRTDSVNFPTTAGSFQTKIGNPSSEIDSDAFVSKLNSGGGLSYSSYLGGPGDDGRNPYFITNFGAIQIDPQGNAYIVGNTSDETTFPEFALVNRTAPVGYFPYGTYIAKISDSAPSYSITGRITDVSNNPLAGITVEAKNTQGLSHTGVTDSQGFYAVISLPAGDYTVTPGRNPSNSPAHYVYTPPTRTFLGLNADQTAANFTGSRVYDITGRVTSSTVPGLGIFDVTITATGSSTVTATTDANGNYRLQDLLPGGNYTVTPSKAGFTFGPVDYSFTNLTSDLGQVDFTTASGTFFTVSGRIANANNSGIANVLITTLVTSMQGSRTQTTLTDANGEYSIPNLQTAGNYTITPSKANFIFSPPSRTFNNLTANQTGANFVATAVVAIRGRVTVSGAPLSGVTMTLSDGAAAVTTTDANGDYAFIDLPAPNNFTVTPSKVHHSFAPANLMFSAITVDQNSANFSATVIKYSISGNISAGGAPLSAVTVALSSSTQSGSQIIHRIVTNTNGDYSFTNLDGSADYTVTPSKVNYAFNPTSLVFNNLSANQTSANFVATRTGYTIQVRVYRSAANQPGVSGVTVTLTGPTNATGVTSSGGFVTFDNLQPGGNYTVTPSQTDFRFNPANAVFNNLMSDFLAQFQRDPIYRVSGRVADAKGNGIPGVSIVFGPQVDPPPTGPFTTTTDSSGNYAFEIVGDGFFGAGISQAVYPSKAGYSFTPILYRNTAGVDIPGISFGSIPKNQPTTLVANFTATHSISGRVTDSNGGVSGVTMTLSGQGASIVTTDVNGNYSFLNQSAGNDYTITPSKAGLAFAPPSRTFTSLGANQTGVNFGAQAVHAGFEPVVLTTDQVEIKTWTFQGRTYAYVKLLFPNGGYSVINWGQAVRSVNDFAADAAIERSTGPALQWLTTTAQIYDLGPLTDGNYTFTFKNSGVLVKSQAFSVSSAVPPPNPIDNAREFVRQQYRDFLNREADQAGEDFWTDNITKCSDPARRPPGQTEAQCTLRQRETTSGAFFLSPEFQYTGYYVYRMYVGALGRAPKLSEFIPDAQFVGNGIVVNGQLSAAKINQNKADFAAQFANCIDATKSRCAEFKARYDSLNNTQYVDKLFETTGVNASANDRADLVNSIGASQTRASVLQKIVDGINVIAEGNQQFTTTYGQAFYDQQLTRAFVQLEYFGYMRRDPDEAGYNFWLAKLNQFGGNFVNAEMVLAFISSPEYRARFGQP